MTERTPIAPVPQLKRQSAIPQPPPPRARIVQEATGQESAKPALPVAAPPSASKAPKPARTRSTAPSTGRHSVRPISLSVPSELLEEFRRFAKRTETSYADLLMDAIGARHDDLPELVDAALPETTNDGLFVRETRTATSTLGTLSVRMLAVNVEAIDKLVTEVGAPSRSQLCVAALASYLAPR